MEAHGTMLEVLGKTKEGEISRGTFNKTGCLKYQCVFCTITFDTLNLRNHHIIMYHWESMDKPVSLCVNSLMYLHFYLLITIL